jgi:hypothetical protein
MSIELQIRQLIGKLSAAWFIELKKEFEKHPFYNNVSCKIDYVYQQTFQGYDFEKDEMTDDIVDIAVEATLPEYAWRGEEYPYEVEDKDLVIKGDRLASEIIEILDKLLKETSSTQDKYKLIKSVVGFVKEQAEELKGEFQEANYLEAIDYCVYLLRIEITNKYVTIKYAHEVIQKYDEKLVFDLSQNELAFLLAVLLRANFFQGTNTKSFSYDFFRKYFYFRNQKEGDFSRATIIHKKISEVYSGNSSIKIREKIKKRLIQAIQSL